MTYKAHKSQCLSPQAKFWMKVKILGQSVCWEWEAYKNPAGYGQIRHEGKGWLAHRLAYRLEKGIIPSGQVVRHSCNNPGCCNPEHLSLGTQAQNIEDRTRQERHYNQLKTECAKGHPLTDENLVKSQQGRQCRTCWNERSKQYRTKSK